MDQTGKPRFQTRAVDAGVQSYEVPSNPWKPGAICRMPWLGFGALLGAILGIATAIFVLFYSDGHPISHWTLQPTVYLAIASAVTNILLHFALTEGVNVFWWKSSMRSGATVGDLHYSWAFGNSVWAALTSGKKFNVLAAASLLVAITPVNGPFLQRASTIGLGHFSTTRLLDLYLAPVVPPGYTGFISGRGYECSLLTSNFTNVVNGFNAGSPINITATTCEGTCTTEVQGVGFKVECSRAYVPYNVLPAFPNGTIDLMAATQGTEIFATHFSWSAILPSQMMLTVKYKGTPTSNGTLLVRECTFQHATVLYPVTVINQTTIGLSEGTTMFDDKIVQTQNISDIAIVGPTTIGGLARALANIYESKASMRFAGAVGYEILSTGATAIRYAVLPGNYSYMDYTAMFRDPTDDLIASARDLMFRTAVHAANWSNVQTVEAADAGQVPVFKTSYLYLGIAAAFSALGIILTVPLFAGYHRLGRATTMSPLETAKAFSPPQLQSSDSNAEVSHLIEEVGHREIRYGATAAVDMGLLSSNERMPGEHGFEMRLGMGSPDRVLPPQPGIRYRG